jgi:hypothetical protein
VRLRRTFPRGFFFRSSPLSAVLQAPSGASSSSATPIARNLAQVIATRLLKLPLAAIAETLHVDETAACRVRANERAVTLNGWLALMELVGYKIVPRDLQCVPGDELRMLRRTYADKHGLSELQWDDPE